MRTALDIFLPQEIPTFMWQNMLTWPRELFIFPQVLKWLYDIKKTQIQFTPEPYACAQFILYAAF